MGYPLISIAPPEITVDAPVIEKPPARSDDTENVLSPKNEKLLQFSSNRQALIVIFICYLSRMVRKFEYTVSTRSGNP